MQVAEFLVLGVSSEECTERVASALRAVEGVRDVQVSRIASKARVWYERPCTPAMLAWAILRAGYGVLLPMHGQRFNFEGMSLSPDQVD